MPPPVLTGNGFALSIERGISSSLSRQICGGARWSSLYTSSGDFFVPSGWKTAGSADTSLVNWIWGLFGSPKAVAYDGDRVLDGGCRYVIQPLSKGDSCFILFAIMVREGEIAAVVGDKVLWDGDEGLVADREWKPGDPILLPHIIIVDAGAMQ
ncbi:hypothetical protein ACLB2K_002575 [Fragaria x ananassa]